MKTFRQFDAWLSSALHSAFMTTPYFSLGRRSVEKERWWGWLGARRRVCAPEVGYASMRRRRWRRRRSKAQWHGRATH